ncbi:MAG TPA: hypothetical protein VGI89_08455 [Rhizomicrobium sp.]|jgi:hypothetical protein
MTIQDLVRRDYLDAVKVTEAMAERFPDGSPERARWLRVAATYRQVTEELVTEQERRGQAAARPVALNPGPQPS